MKNRVADEMREKLQAAFAPTRLEIVNESHRHAGHAGDDGSGESHFRIAIAAPAFAPMTRIERHRAVHTALGPSITKQVHALALEISA